MSTPWRSSRRSMTFWPSSLVRGWSVPDVRSPSTSAARPTPAPAALAWVVAAALKPQAPEALKLIAGRGPQPQMSRASVPAGCTVLFDGVLYNRKDLIAELGRATAGLNNADLLLAAYNRWGL